MNDKKKILLTIGLIFLIFVFTPIFGKIYELIIGRNITSWFGTMHPGYYEGFLMSYTFFVTALVILFTNKKYKLLGILLGAIFLIDVILGAWENLIINVGTALVAFILAKIILMIYQKVKK